MADELDPQVEQTPEPIGEVDVDSVLRDYHRRQLILHMTGPIISLVAHVIVLVLMSQFVTGQRINSRPPVEVQIRELELKELEKPLQREIDIQEPDEVIDAPDVVDDSPPAPVETEVASTSLETIGDDAPSDAVGLEGLTFAQADVADVVTPLKIAGIYSNRTGEARARSVQRGGGDKASQEAVEKTLEWLQSIQKPDGSWVNSPAHSGLALLVFLAHGETPLSEKYGRTVQLALQWLANDMMRLKTNVPGKPDQMAGGNVYSHGIASYAMAEAYGMTQIPFLRSAMEKGLDIIIRGQQSRGGFDYRYDKGDRWDLSVGGWQIQAMKAGKAAGANNPGLEQAIERSIKWIKEDTYKAGKFGYASAGSGGNMTGVGTVCLQLLGEAKSAEARGGAETIAGERLSHYSMFASGTKDFEREGHGYIYGWYYDTQAMFNTGGKFWRSWNNVFQKVLVRSQNSAGYWEFKDERSHYGKGESGRILVTCWAALQLEVYYRYLPTFDIKKMESKTEASAAKSILDDSGLIIE